MTASIRNDGEDSYGTMMLFSFPAGVSYRKVTLLQVGDRAEEWGAELEGTRKSGGLVGGSVCFAPCPDELWVLPSSSPAAGS